MEMFQNMVVLMMPPGLYMFTQHLSNCTTNWVDFMVCKLLLNKTIKKILQQLKRLHITLLHGKLQTGDKAVEEGAVPQATLSSPEWQQNRCHFRFGHNQNQIVGAKVMMVKEIQESICGYYITQRIKLSGVFWVLSCSPEGIVEGTGGG